LNVLKHCRARLINPEEKTSPNSRLGSPSLSAAVEKVVIDPSRGGAISPKSASQSKALQVDDGVWIWDGVVKVLEVDLFSAAWEVRHGAAMGLRELLKLQGKCGGMRGGSVEFQNDLTLIDFFAILQTIFQFWKMKLLTRNGVTTLLPSYFAYSSWIALATLFLTRSALEVPHNLLSLIYIVGGRPCQGDGIADACLTTALYASPVPPSRAFCFTTDDSPGLYSPPECKTSTR